MKGNRDKVRQGWRTVETEKMKDAAVKRKG